MLTYYNLKSIIAAQKKSSFTMRAESDSFRIAPKRQQPYIEPSFNKELFEAERPPVILVSAVGATGKTTLAEMLSAETGLPLLNLARHKPVGDNTLTGVLTSAFRLEDLSGVFEAIVNGSFGLIIDGLDEGRSKTTSQAFEAFLDDIIRLCGGDSATSFVLLGRSQSVEDCWSYLTGKGVETGVVTIAPFDLDSAREYIDAFTGGPTSSHAREYCEVRDDILKMLGAAFVDRGQNPSEEFLSFIGYPPVLDAIVTLLSGDANYYKIKSQLDGNNSQNVETSLLHRIAFYILQREKNQKVVPNIIELLTEGMPAQMKQSIARSAFEPEEQCLRLVSHCLGRPLSLQVVPDPLINEKYEERLTSWLHEHPFLAGGAFRNAVFESVALATLVASRTPSALELALDYAASHKHNYHLIYFLDRIADCGRVPLASLELILGSALEFRSTTTTVELQVEGPELEDGWTGAGGRNNAVEIQIEVIMGKEREQAKMFTFQSDLQGSTTIRLGGRLAATEVSLPCDVVLYNSQELELTAPVEINAAKVILQAPALVLRQSGTKSLDAQVLLEATRLESTVGTIITNGVGLSIALSDRGGVTYPCIQYVTPKDGVVDDPTLKEKYLRLKRILVHFRSHSRGSLARYRRKIENERVAGSGVGWAVLEQLRRDEIVSLRDNFYYLEPAKVDELLGVSWPDLRMGRTSPRLLQYLRSIS